MITLSDQMQFSDTIHEVQMQQTMATVIIYKAMQSSKLFYIVVNLGTNVTGVGKTCI